MGNNFCYANVDTPTPRDNWRQMTDDERLDLITKTLASNPSSETSKMFTVAEAKSDGQVIVKLLGSVTTDKRGTLLLDLEEFLKEAVDPGLIVWLEPLADRSSLRNLRGIEIKS